MNLLFFYYKNNYVFVYEKKLHLGYKPINKCVLIKVFLKKYI